ncbi:MAG: ATP-binding protein [Candidatus Diapherotrites archaeon]|nr:ATP-binding protein [Candidatus Diapherotrites archaeon]
MDARLSVIDERLAGIKRIVAVSGCKGGIGKSSVACSLALLLSKANYRVGLLDLDFFSPADHIMLGVRNVFPKEEKGLVPAEVAGIRFMSIVYFIEDRPAALRGIDVSNAIIELLAITQWHNLDFLIIDMPPGIADATLDVIRLMKRIEFLIVATGSKLALDSVTKLIKMLKALNIPILGIIENMRIGKSNAVQESAKTLGINFLGTIEFDYDFEDCIGNVDALMKSKFVKQLSAIVAKHKGLLR